MMFTTFTDRDGKYQLLSLAESAFDPLRAHLPLHAHRGGRTTCSWARPASRHIVQPPPSWRAKGRTRRPRRDSVRQLQRYLTSGTRSPRSLRLGDLDQRANYFGGGVEGRPKEERLPDHVLLEGARASSSRGRRIIEREVALGSREPRGAERVRRGLSGRARQVEPARRRLASSSTCRLALQSPMSALCRRVFRS